MANFTVVFDANVLYPAPLRDLLMSVALTEQFRAKWTDEIHDEWVRNLLKNRHDITKYGVEAQSPDVFLNHLYDLNPTAFCSAVHQQRKRLKTPTYSAEKLLDTFYKQGLPLIVSKLKNNIDLI